MRRILVAAAGLLLAGCGGADPATAPEPEPSSPSISTLSPLPMPDMGPPEGRLVADLRQSSRDAALGRFQVWIGNGLARDLDPVAITYDDPRYRAPIAGERLRAIPSDSERGYPLALPGHPVCDGPADRRVRGTVTLDLGDRTETLRVADEADVVARHVATRCFELTVARVAALSFDDDVPVDGTGQDSVGTLLLRITPSGRPGGVLTIDSVSGTPILTPHGRPVWRPDATVRSDGEEVVLELPVVPARCDGHAFGESGGATAFRVRLRLDGEPGETLVRMSSTGAANAIGFAKDACGL